MGEVHNVFARNYERFTLDVTVGRPWRWRVKRRKWRFLTADPENQRTYLVDIGPIGVHVWVKADSVDTGGPTEEQT